MAQSEVVGVYPHFRDIDGYIVHLEEREGDTLVETDVFVDADTLEIRGADVTTRVETHRHLSAEQVWVTVDVEEVLRAVRAWR